MDGGNGKCRRGASEELISLFSSSFSPFSSLFFVPHGPGSRFACSLTRVKNGDDCLARDRTYFFFIILIMFLF